MADSSLVVNMFVLKNWAKIPPREGMRLAKWATSANYSFRSGSKGDLLLENPVNGKSAVVEREVDKDGKPRYYFKIIQRGRPRKKCFNYELESFILLSMFPRQRVFPTDVVNIKIRDLEEE